MKNKKTALFHALQFEGLDCLSICLSRCLWRLVCLCSLVWLLFCFFLLSPFLCAPSSVLVHWCPTILPVCLFFFLAVHALPVCLYVCLYICTSTSSVCHFALVVCPLCVRWRRNGTKPDVTPFFFLRIDSAAAVGIKTGKTRGKISSFPHRVLNARGEKVNCRFAFWGYVDFS